MRASNVSWQKRHAVDAAKDIGSRGAAGKLHRWSKPAVECPPPPGARPALGKNCGPLAEVELALEEWKRGIADRDKNNKMEELEEAKKEIK